MVASLRTVAKVGGLSIGVMAAQAAVAVLRPVPDQREFDASGIVGSGDPMRTWTVLGDSTTTGTGLVGVDDIWVRQLARRVGGTVQIRSVGQGGARARDVVAHQLVAACTEPSDVAFLSIGANDVLKGESIARFRSALDTAVYRLCEVHRVVVVSGVGDLGTIPRLHHPLRAAVAHRGRRFDRVSAEVADRHGAAKLVRPSPLTRSMYGLDLFHPNVRGHTIWADAAQATLAAFFPVG